jgi:16S rRNA (guanine527-N7)-methyltransferase
MNPMSLERFGTQAQSMGVVLSPVQCQKFEQFASLLARWNTVYNLTHIEPGQDTLTAHMLDSLSANAYVVGPRVLDVGTGAGFPGIPLAIVRPESHFLLMDSNRKKTRFVLQVRIELNLANADVVSARIEQWPTPEPFDTIITRAFSQIGATIAQAQHALRSGGQFVFMKGHVPTDELQALPPGFQVTQMDAVSIPGLDAVRHVIVVRREESDMTGLPP